MFKYLLLTALLYFISYLYYVKVSHGLGHKAEFLQLRRFLPCALLAVAPAATAQIQLTNSLLLTSIYGIMKQYNMESLLDWTRILLWINI